MLRDGRLRNVQKGLQLADAHVALVLEDFQDFDPVRVGQRLHDLDEQFHHSPLIFKNGNISNSAPLSSRLC
jgi:hypothetical protein